MCDYTIDNNGDLKRLQRNVDVLIRTIFRNQGLGHLASNAPRPFEESADS